MNKENINDLFAECFSRDKSYIKKWIVSWDYQVIRKKRNQKYTENLPDDFFTYQGKQDLVKWMKWFTPAYPNYLETDLLQSLISESLSNDQKILQKLGLEYDFSDYHLKIGLNNAHDFLLPRIYPVPERFAINNVLDFGAGYGRQANLWSTKSEGTYLAMDATPNAYCLQDLYFRNLDKPLYDYAENPGGFAFHQDKKGIYHLPTWRSDLIPDNSFDLVMCVQVLPELNSKLVKRMLLEFNRILKPGGMLYIRDNAYSWKPAGKINVEQFLLRNNFVLEFKPHVIDKVDITGIPRVWRKIDPAVRDSQRFSFHDMLNQSLLDIDTLSGGRLGKVKRKVKNR